VAANALSVTPTMERRGPLRRLDGRWNWTGMSNTGFPEHKLKAIFASPRSAAGPRHEDVLAHGGFLTSVPSQFHPALFLVVRARRFTHLSRGSSRAGAVICEMTCANFESGSRTAGCVDARPVAVRPPAILATTIDLGAVTSWTAWGQSGEESSVIRAFFQDCASVIRFGVTSASFAETGK
jgi:hypothetical protein